MQDGKQAVRVVANFADPAAPTGRTDMRSTAPRLPHRRTASNWQAKPSPPVIDLGEFGSTTIELAVHVQARPAPGWLACRASTRHVIDGFHDGDFEIWDATGALVAQSRQLALLPRGSR